MNRLFSAILLLALVNAVMLAKSLDEIEAEIATTEKNLVKRQNDEGSLQKQVDLLSREIGSANSQILEIDRLLKANQNEIAKLTQVVEAQKSEYTALGKERDLLLYEKEAIERKLADLLAIHTAQSLVLSRNEAISEEDIIKESLFFMTRDRVKLESEKLKSTYSEKMLTIRKLETKIGDQQRNIDRLKNTQNHQQQMREEQAKLIGSLDKRKVNYLSELNRLIDQKNRERQLLADLRIVHQKTVDQMKQAHVNSSDIASGTQIAVKQYGTSYQSASNSSYKGKKVKAPLDSTPIAVTKEFGPYTDPVYNIKIHNDSVTLKPEGSDALVRTVLPGKVVFADNLKMLGKVVIVEHQGNIHTIYRNLESISPNIKVDRSLKERESIGRINSELVFEVTKDGLPINPLQLISI
ncbi:peptidase M23 [Campylobacterota bacterium]|nr:peptidase M23 [Campylobacterota bacterium]